MTSRELADAARHAIDAYEYPTDGEALIVGPWDQNAVQAELRRLRDALVAPTRRRLFVHERAPERGLARRGRSGGRDFSDFRVRSCAVRARRKT